MTKNHFDVLSASGDEDCNKSVSTSGKLLKQRPNGAKKKKNPVIISDLMLKRVSGPRLSRDIEKEERIQ